MEPQHIVLQWNWPKKNLHYYLLVDFFLMSSHTAVRTMTIARSTRPMVWAIAPTIVRGNALDIMKLNTGSCTTQGTTGTCVSQCSIPLDAIDAVDTIDGVASVVQTNEQIWLVQHSCIRHDKFSVPISCCGWTIFICIHTWHNKLSFCSTSRAELVLLGTHLYCQFSF